MGNATAVSGRPTEDAQCGMERTVTGMAEYIEKEETIQRYQNVVDIVGIAKSADGETKFGLVKDLDVIEFLQALPAADVRENVKAEWSAMDDDKDCFECSECDAIVGKRYRFCPNCGAQMLEVVEDD